MISSGGWAKARGRTNPLLPIGVADKARFVGITASQASIKG